MGDGSEWTLAPTGHPGDLSIIVIPNDEGLPETFDEDGRQEWWERVEVVPKERAVAAEAERDALCEALLAARVDVIGVNTARFDSTRGECARKAIERIDAALAASVSSAREDPLKPRDDSHWATVVIDDENFEPREATEAESVLLDEVGVLVERMWIQPGRASVSNEEARDGD